MKRNNVFTLLAFVLAVFALASCAKTGVDTGNQALEQYRIDSVLIKNFIASNGLQMQEIMPNNQHTSIYYQVLQPGSGTVDMGLDKNIYVQANYEVRLLDGGLVDKGMLPQDTVGGKYYDLNQLIAAFQLGVRQVQPGGTVRFITPSYYAYKTYSYPARASDGTNTFVALPANSVLDCRVTLIKAKN